MIEPFTDLLVHPERTVAADAAFTATLNPIAAELEAVALEILALWNEIEKDWPREYSELQNLVQRKEVTLTAGELTDVRAAIAATRTAASTKELTMDDAFKNVYKAYRYALSRFTGLRLYNSKIFRELTVTATVAKVKK